MCIELKQILVLELTDLSTTPECFLSLDEEIYTYISIKGHSVFHHNTGLADRSLFISGAHIALSACFSFIINPSPHRIGRYLFTLLLFSSGNVKFRF